MGRSVSTPTNASVTYLSIDMDDSDDFQFFLECLQERASDLWPSMQACSYWLDSEDHAIAENRLAYFGVSEYCGLAAIWLLPKEPSYLYSEDAPHAFGQHWVHQAEEKLSTLGNLRHVATASNGEAFFQAA